MFSKLSTVLFSIASIVSAYDVTITNNCSATIWPAAAAPLQNLDTQYSGFALASGQSAHIQIPTTWSAGRIWARTGCNAQGLSCASGDCGALQCGANVYASYDVTLAEFSYGSYDLTYYDISLLSGFNLGMQIAPYTPSGPCRVFTCASTSCSYTEAYVLGEPDTNNPVGACADTLGFTVTFCPGSSPAAASSVTTTSTSSTIAPAPTSTSSTSTTRSSTTSTTSSSSTLPPTTSSTSSSSKTISTTSVSTTSTFSTSTLSTSTSSSIVVVAATTASVPLTTSSTSSLIRTTSSTSAPTTSSTSALTTSSTTAPTTTSTKPTTTTFVSVSTTSSTSVSTTTTVYYNRASYYSYNDDDNNDRGNNH